MKLSSDELSRVRNMTWQSLEESAPAAEPAAPAAAAPAGTAVRWSPPDVSEPPAQYSAAVLQQAAAAPVEQPAAARRRFPARTVETVRVIRTGNGTVSARAFADPSAEMTSQAARYAAAQHTVLPWIPEELHPIPVNGDNSAAPSETTAALEEIERARQALEASRQQIEEEARQTLALARQQADEVLSQAQEEARQIAEQAYRQAVERAEDEVREKLAVAGTIYTEMNAWRENLLRQSESMVIELVQEIARKLFGEGFALDPGQLDACFQRVLDEAKSLGELRVRAHPDDVEALGPLWPSQQTARRGQKIELVPDQDIQRGGCYIDGQYGSVDGRLSVQLEFITGALTQPLDGLFSAREPVEVRP
ncbi:MAG: hypothetical protein GX495_16270 [Chloroflexi bacterium]|nr:hypothetical protein [Chloroflexota bacterium]